MALPRLQALESQGTLKSRYPDLDISELEKHVERNGRKHDEHQQERREARGRRHDERKHVRLPVAKRH